MNRRAGAMGPFSSGSVAPAPPLPHFLGYRVPYDWTGTLGYLRARATPGVEAVTGEGGGRYWRTLRAGGCRGCIAVSPGPRPDALRLELAAELLPAAAIVGARMRRLFDLDADPAAVAGHLRADSLLAPLVARRPGLRLPGAADGFELALRAVLGQQVTVRGASTLAGRLVRLVAEPMDDGPALAGAYPAPLTHFAVTAERLADASVASLARIGLPRARAGCVLALARAAAEGALPELTGGPTAGDPGEFVRRLTGLPGIGPWTAAYVAMRALPWPDAFPEHDLGLRKAMGRLSPAGLRARAEPWRPWRAYAAQHLWASLGRGRPGPA